MKKRFIVRKYIMAESVKQALILDKNCPVDEIYIDNDWQKAQDSAGREFGFQCKK